MSRKRGIVLITTLILVVMIVMLLTAATNISRGSFSMSESVHSSAGAMWAAQCGIQYAMTRLRERPAWRGDGTGTGTFSGDYMVAKWAAGGAGIQVREDHGNVLGMVRTPNGSRSQFRIRFNWQDGSPGKEGLDDPTTAGSTYMYKFPYVSINNLASNIGKPAPRGDVAAGSCAVPFPLPAAPSPTHPYDVGPYQILLIVEGRAGDPLGSVNNLDTPDPPSGAGYVSVRYVETMLAAESPLDPPHTVLDTQADINIDVKNSKSATVTSADKGLTPIVRVNGNTNVISGSLDKDSKTGGELQRAGTKSGSVTLTDVTGPVQDLLAVDWGQVAEASEAQPSDKMDIKAGTYVYQSDDSGSMGLYYFPKNWDDPILFASGGAGGLIAQNLASLQAGSGPIAGVTKVSNNFANMVNVSAAGTDNTGIGARNDLIGYVSGSTQVTFKGAIHVKPDAATPGVDKFALLLGTGDLNGDGQGDDDDDGDGQGDDGGGDAQASNCKILFQPNAGYDNSTVSSDNGVKLYGRIEGSAGSITVGYNGMLTPDTATLIIDGAGTNLAANEQSPVNLYAMGDIKMSTVESNSKGKGNANDIDLKGVIYTWGDFTANLDNGTGGKGDFNYTGTIVAAGGAPDSATKTIGSLNGRGTVNITANQSTMQFNSSYLIGLSGAAPGVGLRRMYSVVY